jgi:hypothetical protein
MPYWLQVSTALFCYTVSLVTVVITMRAGDYIQQSVAVSSREVTFWRGMSHLRTAVTLLAWCLSAGVTGVRMSPLVSNAAGAGKDVFADTVSNAQDRVDGPLRS